MGSMDEWPGLRAGLAPRLSGANAKVLVDLVDHHPAVRPFHCRHRRFGLCAPKVTLGVLLSGLACGWMVDLKAASPVQPSRRRHPRQSRRGHDGICERGMPSFLCRAHQILACLCSSCSVRSLARGRRRSFHIDASADCAPWHVESSRGRDPWHGEPMWQTLGTLGGA